MSADRLLIEVVEELGLDDFGDDRYVDEYRRRHPGGMDSAHAGHVLRMQRDLKAHPEIHDEVLAPPLVISGFARTGTTKLQRLISVSPAAQSLQLWKLLNPASFPDDPPDSAQRIAFAEGAARMAQQVFPEMWAAYPTPPLDAEEDLLLHDMTFVAPTIGMRFGAAHLMDALTPMNVRLYEFLRTVLQYLQWQDRSAGRGTHHATRPWVLKSPIHIGNVSTLLQVFPGARFVFCHRNFEVAMASLCSLDEISRHMFSAGFDRNLLGKKVLDYWSREWRCNLEQRARLDPKIFCDIRFDDITVEAVVLQAVNMLAALVARVRRFPVRRGPACAPTSMRRRRKA